MQVFVRPQKPASFDTDVKDAIEALEEFFRIREQTGSLPPTPVGVGQPAPEAPKKPDFPDKWKKFKGEFSDAQHGKCGYCEMDVIGGQAGDVEHFFPKGEVWELGADPKTWGAERKSLSTVEGRKHNVIAEHGYWWLAYHWDNYLLACEVCNQYWKLSFFPVADTPRNLPPAKDKNEDALLLNPFGTEYDPCDHLAFDDLGQISALDKSLRGLATIQTCGLDRESIRKKRIEKASRAHFLVKELFSAAKVNDRNKIFEVLRDFKSLGDENFAYSGMVRAIFCQGTGMKWKALEDILAKEDKK